MKNRPLNVDRSSRRGGCEPFPRSELPLGLGSAGARRLSLITDFGDQLLGGADPDSEALPQVFERVRHETAAEAAFSFVTSDRGPGLWLTAHGGIDAYMSSDCGHRSAGEGICGTVAEHRQALVVNQVQQSTDPNTELLKQMDLRAYVCEPLVADGEFFGTLSFGSRSADHFEGEDLLMFQALASQLAAARARQRSDRDLLRCNRELQHRVNNMLSMVQSIAILTGRASTDGRSFISKFSERLHALARGHNQLTSGRGVSLQALLEGELEPHVESGRVTLDGPPATVPSEDAIFAGLVFHELALNAAAHGALGADGSIDIRWSLESGGKGPVLRIRWNEIGMAAANDSTPGFGTWLLDHTPSSQVNVARSFSDRGLEAVIDIRLP